MGEGALILQKRFRPADPHEDRKTFTEYVCRQMANDVMLDEMHELMGYYGCSCEELVDRVVADKMGITHRKSRKRNSRGSRCSRTLTSKLRYPVA